MRIDDQAVKQADKPTVPNTLSLRPLVTIIFPPRAPESQENPVNEVLEYVSMVGYVTW